MTARKLNQANSQLLLGAGSTERMMRLAAGQTAESDEGDEKAADA